VAKVSRKRLARGTKLTTDHIQTPMASIASEINNGTIEQEQLADNDGSFRINLHIPYLASDFPFSTDATSGGAMQEFAAFSIPFTLPPTQDMFAATASGFALDEEQPFLTLDEVSFSFDQRGEPCAVKDQMKDNLGAELYDVSGNMDFDMVDSYDLSIGLVEKPQEYFGESEFNFQKTVFSAPLSYQLFQADTRRFNPFLVTGINASLSPYKTYAFTIRAPALGQTGSKPATRKSQALVSVQISLKVRATMMQRDVYDAGANALQNWPTTDAFLARRSRAVIGQSITVTPPAANDPILADTGAAATAVSTVMGTIDEEFRHRLAGGVDENCETAPLQQLLDDSSYEVLAVPLMNNRRYGGIISRYVNEEPYSAGAAGPVWDRRVVPIYYPMVIHHVVLAWNWNRFYANDPTGGASPDVADNVPASVNFTAEVGVGIGEGLRSDGQGYQQIAGMTITKPADPHQPSAGWRTTMFDRCSANAGISTTGTNYQSNGAVRPAPATTGNFNWEWELHSMPLVGAGGSGYYATGHPIFVGKAWSPTAPRTNIAGVASTVAGREEFLEVRMKISDSGGFPVNDEVVSGYQGHWVYIIGKKFLTR